MCSSIRPILGLKIIRIYEWYERQLYKPYHRDMTPTTYHYSSKLAQPSIHIVVQHHPMPCSLTNRPIHHSYLRMISPPPTGRLQHTVRCPSPSLWGLPDPRVSKNPQQNASKRKKPWCIKLWGCNFGRLRKNLVFSGSVSRRACPALPHPQVLLFNLVCFFLCIFVIIITVSFSV